MFTFGRLLAQATTINGYKFGEVLENPMSAQCIVSDGFRLTFIGVQLNTLEFATDEGIKNIAWVLPGNQMYEKVSYNEGDSMCEVDAFNEDCFKVFTKMIISGISQ